MSSISSTGILLSSHHIRISLYHISYTFSASFPFYLPCCYGFSSSFLISHAQRMVLVFILQTILIFCFHTILVTISMLVPPMTNRKHFLKRKTRKLELKLYFLKSGILWETLMRNAESVYKQTLKYPISSMVFVKL